MTDSKPGTGTEWPDKNSDVEPTTGGESYGGMTKQPESGVTGQTGGLTENKPGPDQDEAEPRQEFPGKQQGSIGNRGPDPAEGEDRSTTETKAQSPNAGQPRGKDQGNEQSTGS